MWWGGGGWNGWLGGVAGTWNGDGGVIGWCGGGTFGGEGLMCGGGGLWGGDPFGGDG
jgi:hypothetical protein